MDYIFENKKKNIIAICFSLFYIVMLALKIDFRVSLFQNFRYTINFLFVYLTPMIVPVLILTLILTHKKDYKFKPLMFPVAFGVSFVLSLITQIFNISNMKSVISLTELNYAPIYLCSFLICLANGLMFLGTLFSFKHIKLLKYGALGCAILYLCSSIAEFIVVGGFKYIQSVPEEYSAINIFAFLYLVSQILFYIGIFMLIPNKNKAESVKKIIFPNFSKITLIISGLLLCAYLTIKILEQFDIYLYLFGVGTKEIVPVVSIPCAALFFSAIVFLLYKNIGGKKPITILAIIISFLILAYILLPYVFSADSKYFEYTSDDEKHNIVVNECSFLLGGWGVIYEKTSFCTMKPVGNYSTDDGFRPFSNDAFFFVWYEDYFKLHYSYFGGETEEYEVIEMEYVK